jgi:dihydroflavonol-4-reductase
MKWLVTGATGLVGNNVVRQLTEGGESVRALVRTESIPRALEGLSIEVLQGDVLDPSSIERAAEGVDCVVHAAALVHIGWSMADEQRAINVDGTRHVAQAAKQVGAKLIHVSSVDALGVDPTGRTIDEDSPAECPVLCPYVVTKRDSERVVREFVEKGLRATIVNPGFMLGPWDWKPSSGQMLLEVAQGRMLLAPRGSNSYCDVRDVAGAIIEAGKRSDSAGQYILSGPSYTYFDAWTLFAEITGGRRPVREVGRSTMRWVGRAADFVGDIIRSERKLNSATTDMSLLTKSYSSEKARRELGFCSRPLEESARDAWNWFIEHGYARAHPRDPRSL